MPRPYKLAQQKYKVNSTDSVSLTCDNLDSAKQAYDDAVTAYNNYISNWRVQVNGTPRFRRRRRNSIGRPLLTIKSWRTAI